MKKPATFTIEEDVKKRFAIVAKKMKQSQSSIIEELLIEIIPILEAKTPNQMMAKAMQEMAKSINLTASLFDDVKK